MPTARCSKKFTNIDWINDMLVQSNSHEVGIKRPFPSGWAHYDTLPQMVL